MLGKSNKSLSALMALCLAVVQCLVYFPANAVAQSQNYDYDPPLIEPEVVAETEVNYRQTFIATVVDDVELSYVSLFYRFVGEVSYQRINMMQVSRSSSYIAHIPTDPKLGLDVEYYIEASDTSGNRTLHGYAFSPKLRVVIDPEGGVITGIPVADTDTNAAGKNKTVWYVVGGVILLGLLAGLAGGSSGGGGSDCVNGTCDVTITLDQPTIQ